jgi:hypothetical protein
MPRKDIDLKGPGGGETTATSPGWSRKTIWLHGDEAEALREPPFGSGALLMTAGRTEGEKTGLSRPLAACQEGLALLPGRLGVQRPGVYAAP